MNRIEQDILFSPVNMMKPGAMMKTRKVLFLIVPCFILLLCSGCLLSATEESLEQKAARVHDAVFTIDTHVDGQPRL